MYNRDTMDIYLPTKIHGINVFIIILISCDSIRQFEASFLRMREFAFPAIILATLTNIQATSIAVLVVIMR